MCGSGKKYMEMITGVTDESLNRKDNQNTVRGNLFPAKLLLFALWFGVFYTTVTLPFSKNLRCNSHL